MNIFILASGGPLPLSLQLNCLFFFTITWTLPPVKHVLIVEMGVLKKLQRLIILIALHTQRVVSKYFILWSFRIFLPEAEDNKCFLNDGKKSNFYCGKRRSAKE